MKKLILATALIVVATAPTAFARETRMMGNTFTRALNAIEACGALDLLNPPRHVPISSITENNGQVFITVQMGKPATIVFDANQNRVVTEGVCR